MSILHPSNSTILILRQSDKPPPPRKRYNLNTLLFSYFHLGAFGETDSLNAGELTHWLSTGGSFVLFFVCV